MTNYSLFQPWSDMALNTKQGDKDSIAVVAATSYYFCSDEIASPAFFHLSFCKQTYNTDRMAFEQTVLWDFWRIAELNWLSVLALSEFLF